MGLGRVILISISFVLIQFLFSGCEFTPEVVPITRIDSPDEQGPPIQISLNNKYDTIKIGWVTNFSYNVTGTNNKINSVIVTFGEKELHHYIGEYGQTFNFILDPASYSDGSYHLHIEIITSTGSRSLADKLGAEGYLYQMDWPIIIDKTPPRKLNILAIDSLENGVKITWEKFDHPSFKYYKLTKSSSAFMGTYDLVIYDDPHVNSFIDTTYFEGMVVNYQIELAGTCSQLNCSYTNKKQYFQTPPKPKITYISDFEVEVSWEPPKNKNLLDYYYLHGSKTTVSMNEELKIFDPEKRTQRRTLTFGLSNYFGILYVPKLSNQVYPENLLRGELVYSMGEEMPIYHYISPILNSPFVLFSNKGSLYKYNLSSGILTDSLQFNSELQDYFTISNNGNFFGYSENGKFITRTTLDFSLISSMTNTEYENNSINLFMLRLSNTSRLTTVLKDNTLSIYDLITESKIAEKKFGSLRWITARISPDGNHILTEEYDTRLHIVYYQIIGDQIVEMARVNDSELYFAANVKDPFGPDQDIYIIYSGKVEIRNISDFSIKRIIQIASIKNIDYQNMNAFGSSSAYPGSDLTYLYDLESGAVIKNLFVEYLNVTNFHSHYLITNNGQKLNLNNIH
jgi:hypothetical protein